MDPISIRDLCVLDETFYTLCGHVVAQINHNIGCLEDDHNPYIDGFRLRRVGFCRTFYLKEATIRSSYCQFCLDSEYDPLEGEWRSDLLLTGLDDKAISESNIQHRLNYWTRYMQEQRRQFERQQPLESNYQSALQNLIQCREIPELDRLSMELVIANRKRCWYFNMQNRQFTEIRQMVPDTQRAYLFEDDNVNPEILTPVLPADLPHNEICGICHENFVDPEASQVNDVCRTFCNHFYHQNCILPWFRQGNSNLASCPMCRTSRNLIRPPIDWLPHGPAPEVEDDEEDDDSDFGADVVDGPSRFSGKRPFPTLITIRTQKIDTN
ncbi:hypothetical protein NHQ30_011546 [Ciborinia camelliae]|nr:hypothetical protein NHQ30_011546 [Ciborinia camelliae]